MFFWPQKLEEFDKNGPEDVEASVLTWIEFILNGWVVVVVVVIATRQFSYRHLDPVVCSLNIKIYILFVIYMTSVWKKLQFEFNWSSLALTV